MAVEIALACLKGAAGFLGQQLTPVLLHMWEVEDLLIEIDSEAQQIVLVAGSQTSMYQVQDKTCSLHLMKQPPSHECMPLTSLLGHTRVYGRDQSKEAIKMLLLSDDAEGETSLARFVYDNDEVKKWFDLKAWVSVSQDLNVLKLTKNILKELGFLDSDSMPPNSLHCKLQEILKGNKLFLVLDDFWNDDPEECNFLITPLMAGVEGSKIIITTHEKSGRLSSLQNLHPNLLQTLYPIPLQGKSSDKCWLLFLEYAFNDANRSAHSLFKEMFHSIVV
ncbi:hypothetical protein NC652_038764 [Populus alba x Populus x berolinensis]|nr:hypothetical protein NC652_038764 [Populus alba x Populus x berolinensis]